MHLWIIAFFLGVCLLAFCAVLPSLYWLLLLLPVFFVWIFFWIPRSSLPRCASSRRKPGSSKIKRGRETIRSITTHALVFVLGFCWALLYTHWITAWGLPSDLEGKNLLITGRVASLPVAKPHHISFEFQTDSIAGVRRSTKLRLAWYNKFPRKIAPGDKWQFLVRLKRPHSTRNPGGFDLEKHLLVRHIRATGYIVNGDFNKFIDSDSYHYPFSQLRQYLLRKLQPVLLSDSLAPIITALTIGVNTKINQSQWEVLRNTGTNYLVAISGLHIGLVAGVILMLVQFLWRRSKKLPLVLPAREAGIVAGLFVGVVYAAISGFSIPAQRALIMLVVFSLSTLLRRHMHPWNAWLLALFFVVLIDPLAGLTIGFWLSFIAVAAIIYVSSWRIAKTTTYLRKFWKMQLTVTIALLPLTLFFFQQFSLTTLAANLVAMPVVCLVVVPMSLFGVLTLLFSNYFGGWILWLSTKLLHLVWWWLVFLSEFPSSSWYHPVYNWWVLVAACVGVLLLLAPRGMPAKYLGLVWILPLFFYSPAKPDHNEVWFTLLDVGQGLASVVQTANHVLIYDTGPKFLGYDAGKTIIIPYLRTQGVKAIDAMVISHGDNDHIGGANSILKTLPIKNILTSVPKKFDSGSVKLCVAGQNWHWDGVDFEVLSPPKNAKLSGNDASCVLKVTQGANSILLTGDIQRNSEDWLVENYGANLNSDVLVVPHHGSNTSSTKALIDFVAPKYAIFATGYRNRFRFPHKKVVARYEKIGAKLLNTHREGAITFKFSDKSDILSPVSYRRKKRYFWHLSKL
jgi:competence protein ComEC